MSVHYKPLPMSDPDSGLNMDFKSAFSYDNAHAASRKYNSIFEYTNGLSHSNAKENVPLKQSRMCKVWTACFTGLCYLLLFLTLPITGWFSFRTVHRDERLVVFRLGRLKATKGPGLVIVLPCVDRVIKVDLRMKAFSVPPQKILTSDNAAVEAGAELYYRIIDAVLSVSGIQDLDASTRALSQTVLQTHLTKHTLSDIQCNKQMLAQLLMDDINRMTKKWGVEVGRIEISQIKVVQEPPCGDGQAANLLNMVGPALFPAGTSMPGPQKTSCTPAQLLGMQTQYQTQGNTGAQTQDDWTMPQMQVPQQNNTALPTGLMAPFMGGPTLVPPMAMTPPGPAILEMDSKPNLSHNKTSAMMCLDNPQDLIQAVQAHLGPELVNEFGLLYKFIISGSGGGVFYLDLRTGCGSVGEGEIPSGDPADTTLTMTLKVMRRVLKGDLNAFTAYMTGQLTVEGDIQGATDLAKIIDYIK